MALASVKGSDFINSHKLKHKYVVKFNTDALPIDWKEWTKLDIQNEKIHNKQHGIFISLNSFKFVVIELLDEDFEIEFDCVLYEIKRGRKYLPIFDSTHKVFIKIKKNLNIFVKYDLTPFLALRETPNHIMVIEPLWVFLNNIGLVYEHFNAFNKKSFNNDSIFVFYRYMYGLVPNNVVSVQFDDFYSDCVNNGIFNELEVNFIDKYVQHDIIKFCHM